MFVNSFVESEERPLSYMEFEESLIVPLKANEPPNILGAEDMNDVWFTFGEWHDVRAIEDNTMLNYLIECPLSCDGDGICYRLYWFANAFVAPLDVEYHINRLLVLLADIFDSAGLPYVVEGGNHCAGFRDKRANSPWDTDGYMNVMIENSEKLLDFFIKAQVTNDDLKKLSVRQDPHGYMKIAYNRWSTVDVIAVSPKEFSAYTTKLVNVGDKLVNVRTNYRTCLPSVIESVKSRGLFYTNCPRHGGYTDHFKKYSKWLLTYGNKTKHHACLSFSLDDGSPSIDRNYDIHRKYSSW
jgi:hypothetical protein